MEKYITHIRMPNIHNEWRNEWMCVFESEESKVLSGNEKGRIEWKKRTVNFSMLVVGIENGERVKRIQQVDVHTHTHLQKKTDIHSYYGIMWKLFIATYTNGNFLLRTKTLKSALSCIRKTDQLFLYVPLIFLYFTASAWFFTPLPSSIINYNHFKFSTKQLITLINTFQSRDEHSLIINLLLFFYSFPYSLTHSIYIHPPTLHSMSNVSVLSVDNNAMNKKGSRIFLDFILVTRSSFWSVEIVMTFSF